jgi:hypothetical protein
MANQITPVELLERQLNDWKVLLAQLEANPATGANHLAYCKAKIVQLEQDLSDLKFE